MRPDGRLLSAFAPALLAGACGAADPGAVRIVEDSAGVEVVRLRPAGDTLRLHTAPARVQAIGVADGEEPFELAGVVGAVPLSDGRVVVANAETDELRFFAEDGSFAGTVGRDGEGPGEYRAIAWIGVLAGDSLVVYDRSLARISVLDGAGGFARAVTITGAVLPYIAGVLDDTTLAAWQWVGAEDESPGVHLTPVEFGTISLRDGRFEAIGAAQGSESTIVTYGGRPTMAFRPFGRAGDIAAGAGAIFVLAADAPAAIRVYDADGRLVRIVRVEVATPTVTEARVDDWIAGWMATFPTSYAQVEDRWRYGFANTPRPADAPLFRSLEVTTAGAVCAERYPLRFDAAAVYWCFSGDGRLTRVLELPPGLLRLGPYPHFDGQLEIGSAGVVGVWQDSVGVQTVRRYALRAVDGSDATSPGSR